MTDDLTAATSEPPKRIQRRRNAGWRMPAGAVYVGRPTRWGNPFPADYFGQVQAMRLYREWLAGADHLGYPDAEARRRRVLDTLPVLTGRDLACWCPLDQPCHADVLLDLARTKPEPYVHYVGHTVSDEPSQIKVIRASALIQTPAEMLADAEEMASAVKSWLSASPEERNKTTRQAAIHRAEKRAATERVELTLDGLLDKLGFTREYAEHLVQPYCWCGDSMNGWDWCAHARDEALPS